MKSFNKFILNESLNNDYIKELSIDEFNKLHRENCNQYSNNNFLIRFIERTEKYLYVNPENRDSSINSPEDNFVVRRNKLLYEITETKPWIGYPPKSKSLDFMNMDFLEYKLGNNKPDRMNKYCLIPFDGARFTIKNTLISSEWDYIKSRPDVIFQDCLDIFKKINNSYPKNLLDCLNSLDNFFEKIEDVDLNKKTSSEYWSKDFFKKIKNEMVKKNKSFTDVFLDLFEPRKNKIELHNIESLKKRTGAYVGWTDSKVILKRID